MKDCKQLRKKSDKSTNVNNGTRKWCSYHQSNGHSNEDCYRADHLISYLDTLVKTGSESIKATLRRRRIVFAGFVARMEDTRLPKCVMFGEMVESVEKRMDEVFSCQNGSLQEKSRLDYGMQWYART